MPSGRPMTALRTLCAALALALSGVAAAPAMAQPVARQAPAQAVIVEALGLVRVQDIDFGRIAARTTAGTVTVNPSTGACTVTGTIIHQGACQFAEFAGQGARRLTVRIQLPGTVTLNGPAGEIGRAHV